MWQNDDVVSSQIKFSPETRDKHKVLIVRNDLNINVSVQDVKQFRDSTEGRSSVFQKVQTSEKIIQIKQNNLCTIYCCYSTYNRTLN